MTTIEDITFIPEPIPEPVRSPGEGRAAVRWEDKLAPLKEKPNESFRAWTYEKKGAATSRVAAIRARLADNTPEDNWTVQVRPVPNADTFGIYVQYNGAFTPEQVAANTKARQERSAKIKAAREAAQTATQAVGAEESVEPAQPSPAKAAAAVKAAAAK